MNNCKKRVFSEDLKSFIRDVSSRLEISSLSRNTGFAGVKFQSPRSSNSNDSNKIVLSYCIALEGFDVANIDKDRLYNFVIEQITKVTKSTEIGLMEKDSWSEKSRYFDLYYPLGALGYEVTFDLDRFIIDNNIEIVQNKDISLILAKKIKQDITFGWLSLSGRMSMIQSEPEFGTPITMVIDNTVNNRIQDQDVIREKAIKIICESFLKNRVKGIDENAVSDFFKIVDNQKSNNNFEISFDLYKYLAYTGYIVASK